MTYGCKNRAPFAKSIEAIDGWENAWLPHRVDVPFRMSPDCEYSKSDLGHADKQCEGCRWRANGQADTGAGVVGTPEPVGSGVVGVLDGQGAEAGEPGTGGVQQPAGVAEEPGTGEQARAAEKLEAKHPNSAIYRRSE